MYTATAVFDLLLPSDARSLKAKRSYVRPIVAALRKFEVAAAEVGALELHGRTEIGVAAVAATPAHAREVVAACEKLIVARPEVDVLGVQHRLFGEDD